MATSKGKFKANAQGGGVADGVAVVAGAAANANIAIAGLDSRADVYAVIFWNAGVPTDVSSEVSVPSAGNIKLSTTNTAAGKLVVYYQQPLST